MKVAERVVLLATSPFQLYVGITLAFEPGAHAMQELCLPKNLSRLTICRCEQWIQFATPQGKLT